MKDLSANGIPFTDFYTKLDYVIKWKKEQMGPWLLFFDQVLFVIKLIGWPLYALWLVSSYVVNKRSYLITETEEWFKEYDKAMEEEKQARQDKLKEDGIIE